MGVVCAYLLNVHKLSLIDLCNRDVVLGCDCKPSLGKKAESYTCFTYTITNQFGNRKKYNSKAAQGLHPTAIQAMQCLTMSV